MFIKSLAITAALGAVGLSGLMMTPSAFAQAKEQFIPVLSYRTGAYAPNGVPFANGYVDYFKYVNAKGGMNGVKILYEECDTGLRHRQGRRVLRTPEGQERRGVAGRAAVHRHHFRADRQGAERQDSHHHHGLRPRRQR